MILSFKKERKKTKIKKMRPVSYLRSEQARFLTLSDIFCGIIIYLRPNMQINTRPYYVRSDFISASSRGRATKTETHLVCALAADSFIFQKTKLEAL